MEIKKIILGSLIIGMMFIVFSPQVEAQTIRTVNIDGDSQTIFHDLMPAYCVTPDLVYVQGDNFVPNSYVDIFMAPWPADLNQNGLYNPGVVPTYAINLANFNAWNIATVYADNNGDINTQLASFSPIIGDWNVIAHQQDGTATWNSATDAIDMLDNYGFGVVECEPTAAESQSLPAIFLKAYDKLASKLSFGAFSSQNTYNSLVVSAADTSAADTSAASLSAVSPSATVYVIYPDDYGIFSVYGDSETLSSSTGDPTDFGESTVTGDFNGDGIDDLAIGLPDMKVSGKAGSGSVEVYYGNSNNGFSNPQVLNEDVLGVSIKANDKFGWSLASGDFNWDGYDDLAIGIPYHIIHGNAKAGMVSVVYGSADNLDVNTAQKWYQDVKGIKGASQEGDIFGWSLTTGDFNSDHFDDLAIGVYKEDIGKKVNAGAVNVIYGGLSVDRKLSSSGNDLWHQNSAGVYGASETNDKFGWSLASGDFNLDGFDDLAIGVPYEGVNGEPDAGAVNVLYGSRGDHLGLSSYENQIWYQGDDFDIDGFLDKMDNFGYSLASGDFNRDGIDDLAIGVPYEMINLKGSAGAVNVIYGNYFGLLSIGNQLWYQDISDMLSSSESDDHFGWSLVAADFNYDGVGDLGVGIPGKDVDDIIDVGAISMIYGVRGAVDDGYGLNAEGNQYWEPGS